MTSEDLVLIPRRILFGDPDQTSLKISPDGSQLLWLAPFDGVLNIWISPRDDPAAARVLTRDTGQGIRFCIWSHNKNFILYLQDKNGDENWHLYAVDLTSGDARDLTPFPGISAQYQSRSVRHPDEIVVGINHRNPQWHDIYRVNITTGERILLLEHDRFVEVITDNDLLPRFAAAMKPGGTTTIYQLRDHQWHPWKEVPPDDLFTTAIMGFGKSSNTLYMKESCGRDTTALVAIDLATNTQQTLAEDPQVDLSGVLLHPTERHVQAVSFVYTRKRWQILDPAIEADFTRLGVAAEGDFSIVSRSRDDNFWIVLYASDDGPARYYLYDRQESELGFLASTKPKLEGLPLSKMHSAIVEARDGLKLLTLYSLPPGSDTNQQGLPDRPLPMVFVPHGGPWMRDYWGFHPWHQWLANRGYAVLSVNFRASTGFGKAFVNAGNLEWGGKIIEDQHDAIRWAIDAGIADPQRMAIMGISFGGYSVLAGMAFAPQLFACGVDLVGVANLITWMESIPDYWKPLLPMLISRVGDPHSDQGRVLLENYSPINRADRICRPLLVGQGANDPRVRPAESDQIVQAMQANGIPVTYALYPDEGHGFSRPQNSQSFHAMVEAFLANHIGGRFEPIGSDFDGASVEILVGAEHVPGLKDLLQAAGKE